MSRTVVRTARELFAKVRASAAGGQRMRLLGVRLEGLLAADEVVEQLELGSRRSGPGWREAEGAVDRAVARFGIGRGPTRLRAARIDREGPSERGDVFRGHRAPTRDESVKARFGRALVVARGHSYPGFRLPVGGRKM